MRNGLLFDDEPPSSPSTAADKHTDANSAQTTDVTSPEQCVHFMSEKDDWETPQYLFEGLNAEFRFEVDVCATPDNAKCKQYFSPCDDGLTQPWRGVCWMNPPYGRQVEQRMRKAFDSSQQGALVVCLIPARTDTSWWHKYAMRGEIRFLRGRLKFSNSRNSAPFPSAVVIFRPPKCGQ